MTDLSSPPFEKPLKSRSRSRSKDRTTKKQAHRKPKKQASASPKEELEKRFKDFEAEIHALDPSSNKTEKNETKKQKTFGITENLILLYNKRADEGRVQQECQAINVREEAKEALKETNDTKNDAKGPKESENFDHNRHNEREKLESQEESRKENQEIEINKQESTSNFLVNTDHSGLKNQERSPKFNIRNYEDQNQSLQFFPSQQPFLAENINFTQIPHPPEFPLLNYDPQYAYALKNSHPSPYANHPQYHGLPYQSANSGTEFSGFNLNSLNSQMTENPGALLTIPKVLPEANVFIKNLNPITTAKDLENAFSVYGNILSCKITTDFYGNSLSYGYIQFEQKEGAEACIRQANNAVFQDMIISVQPFNSKLNKIDGRNNLYIKNLPTYLNNQQLSQKITEIFSKFGPITSSVVKIDRSLNRPFAFVCYENHIYADMAFKALHDTDPFRSGSRLYISWAEKKIDRVKRLTELHTSQQSLQGGNLGMMGMGGGYFQPGFKGDETN